MKKNGMLAVCVVALFATQMTFASLVAEQSTSDPTSLIVSGATLPATTLTGVTSETLPTGQKAAVYASADSSMSFLGAGSTQLLNTEEGMASMWVKVGASWLDNSRPDFLLAEGGDHYGANSFTLFKETNGKIVFRIWAENGQQINASVPLPAGVNVGDWVFVAATWKHGADEHTRVYTGTTTSSLASGYDAAYYYDSRLNGMYWPSDAQKSLYLGKNAGGQGWSVDGSIYGFKLYDSRSTESTTLAADFAALPVPEPITLTLMVLSGAFAIVRRRA